VAKAAIISAVLPLMVKTPANPLGLPKSVFDDLQAQLAANRFHEYFAADLPAEQATFMARSQVFNYADNFNAVITTPAWKSKPSWMLVPTKDRTINPDLERWYAARAKSHVVEVSGASHSVYVSRPKEVAAVIKEAASHAQ
jgi:pimeloyl-ACP methyl ester carboxylesterase